MAKLPKFYSICRECGGSGLVDMGPTERGGPNVSESCPDCKGKYQETYWTLVRLQASEKKHNKGKVDG